MNHSEPTQKQSFHGFDGTIRNNKMKQQKHSKAYKSMQKHTNSQQDLHHHHVYVCYPTYIYLYLTNKTTMVLVSWSTPPVPSQHFQLEAAWIWLHWNARIRWSHHQTGWWLGITNTLQESKSYTCLYKTVVSVIWLGSRGSQMISPWHFGTQLTGQKKVQNQNAQQLSLVWSFFFLFLLRGPQVVWDVLDQPEERLPVWDILLQAFPHGSDASPHSLAKAASGLHMHIPE